MFVPISRIVTLAMAAVLCFALLVPMAIARHNTALAVAISLVFIGYIATNVVLWLRLRPRA